MGTFINNRRLAQIAGVDFDSHVLERGPIVYSRTHLVVSQFTRLSRWESCVLITSFSDASVTDDMARRLPLNVRRWFSNNVETHDPRVTAIPIGIRLSSEGEKILRAAIEKGRLPERNLLYLNCWRRIRNGNNPRKGIYEQFEGKPWITTEGGFDHVPISDFYEQMSSHPYILSPPGAGPDCHRHWESIMLGSIPIVLKTRATDILADLPCLRVENWGEVTEERLKEEYSSLIKRFSWPCMEKVWFEYWLRRIMEA